MRMMRDVLGSFIMIEYKEKDRGGYAEQRRIRTKLPGPNFGTNQEDKTEQQQHPYKQIKCKRTLIQSLTKQTRDGFKYDIIETPR